MSGPQRAPGAGDGREPLSSRRSARSPRRMLVTASPGDRFGSPEKPSVSGPGHPSVIWLAGVLGGESTSAGTTGAIEVNSSRLGSCVDPATSPPSTAAKPRTRSADHPIGVIGSSWIGDCQTALRGRPSEPGGRIARRTNGDRAEGCRRSTRRPDQAGRRSADPATSTPSRALRRNGPERAGPTRGARPGPACGRPTRQAGKPSARHGRHRHAPTPTGHHRPW
jgi:hypothetical protein